MLVQLIKTYKLGELYMPGLPLLKSLISRLERLTQVLLPNLYLHFVRLLFTPLFYLSVNEASVINDF